MNPITILHKAVGYDYHPEIVDETGPAKIHYQATEQVEQGVTHPVWGVTTWERDQQVNKVALANTVAELTHLLRTLEDDIEGATIQSVELSEEVAVDLVDAWLTLFGNEAQVSVRHSMWEALI